MNIAFYVSGNAGRLRKILESGNEEVLAATQLVFSDDIRNSGLQENLEKRGITFVCFDYQTIESGESSKSEVLSDAILKTFTEHEIDYCFCFGDHILKGQLLEVYANKIINFHPSILPMFPGLKAIDQAVEARSNLLGNTAHFIDAGVDTGPIIMQSVAQGALFTGSNYDVILDHQVTMLRQIFIWLQAGRLTIERNVVTVRDADYSQVAFYPALDK